MIRKTTLPFVCALWLAYSSVLPVMNLWILRRAKK